MCDSTEDMAELIQHMQEQRAAVKAQVHRLSVLINRTKDKHSKQIRYKQDEDFRRKLKERSQQAYQKKKAMQADGGFKPE